MGDLIGNKIADKITSVSTELHSKKSPRELHSKELPSNEGNNEIAIIDELRLIL